MGLISVTLVLQSAIVAVINAQNIEHMPNNSRGCHLTINNGNNDMEPEGDPLLLHVRIKILRLREIPDSGRSFSVMIIIYMKWEDKRHIKGNEGRIESCKSKHVEWDREGQFWLPRLDVWDAIELGGYLAGERNPDAIGKPVLRYDVSNGAFLMTIMSLVKIPCEMDFQLYPFDTQTCLFRMRTAKDISQQKLLTTIDTKYDSHHDGKFNLFLRPLNQSWYFSKSRNENISLSGFTAIIERRSMTPFLMNTYLPTGLLTIASFIGFLIPVDMVAGRMALLVTIFLMLVNTKSTEKRAGPVTSEITAMDLWLLLCMMFVALAAFEYTIMLAIRFGKGKKMHAEGDRVANKEKKCNKMDRISLRMFLGIYILAVGSYFYTVASHSK